MHRQRPQTRPLCFLRSIPTVGVPQTQCATCERFNDTPNNIPGPSSIVSRVDGSGTGVSNVPLPNS